MLNLFWRPAISLHESQARQVTADLLRAGGDAIAPADDSTLRSVLPT